MASPSLAVRDVLVNDAGVLAVVSTRVFVSVTDQAAVFPNIAVMMPDPGDQGGELYTLNGACDISSNRIVVECRDESYVVASNLRDTSRTLLSNYSGIGNGTTIQSCLVVGKYDLYSDELGLHRCVLELDLIYDES